MFHQQPFGPEGIKQNSGLWKDLQDLDVPGTIDIQSLIQEADHNSEPSHMCPVCSQRSDTPHVLHYGAICCFSCKAFFRRAHKYNRKRIINCKWGGNCQVTPTDRKCRKCRYDKCIKVGMRPETVLSHDQKRKRFQNAFRRKDEEASSLTLKEPTTSTKVDLQSGCDNASDIRRISDPDNSWIQKKFDLLKKCFVSIDLGEFLFKEFVSYSMGVPLTKSFMKQAIKIFEQRFRSVLLSHPEFSSLNRDQNQILANINLMECVALNVSRLEICADGREQLQFACGINDELQWKKNYEDFFTNAEHQLRKLSLSEVNHVTKSLDESIVEDYNRLTQRIGSFVEDNDMYSIVILAVMFKDLSNSPDVPIAADLGNQYRTMLKQQLHFKCSYPRTNEDPVGDIDAKIVCLFNDVQMLSFILKTLM